MQMRSRYNHGRGNVMIALAPGDMTITSVANGGTISIINACEALHLSLAQHAWTVIRHPIQANLQSARHNIDPVVQIELESVTGVVWHYQRRCQPESGYIDPETVTGNTGRHTTEDSGSAEQSRPNEEGNPQAPYRMRGHAQWTTTAAEPRTMGADH